MPCRVRYLNSAGIMKREIPGIDRLSMAFPKEWLLYTSLNCYPRAQSPMEIDAVVVLDDRVLLLELKDWHGRLTQHGDQWFVNGKKRGRSAVIAVEEKAKKLKSVLRNEIPKLGGIWVDYRVVFTGSSTRADIRENEKKFAWTIDEACSIADPKKRSLLLDKLKTPLLKLYQFEEDFDRVTNTPKLFQPLEADWGGYRVSEQNVVVHPHDVWREHRAERNGEPRIKGLVRIWSFDKLPPGLNSPDRRRLVAEREVKAFAYLTTVGSNVIDGILRDIGPHLDEILTNHFEVRALLPDWTTWDRFLERCRDDLDPSDRVAIASSLLSLISELHRNSVSHRDLGPRSVWVGGCSKMALSGLMCCQLPGEESVEDWLPILKGYSEDIPEDLAGAPTSAKQRDVFLAGKLIATALDAKLTIPADPFSVPVLPDTFNQMQSWLDKCLAANPSNRFADAVQMAKEFAELAETFGTVKIDQALLDRYEISPVPYMRWPSKSFLDDNERRSIYLSATPNAEDVVVKVWHGLRRNVDTATDLALIHLLENASRVMATPVSGFPRLMEVGLSAAGPYIVYLHQKGIPLSELKETSPSDALSIAGKLVTNIISLHQLGCEHGDIAAKNILFLEESKDICILDAFDISPIGDGLVRTPAMCPDNWEKLSQQCLDRYAVLKVVVDLLTPYEAEYSTLVHELRTELARPIVETLEVSLAQITKAIQTFNKPPLPIFSLFHPHIQGQPEDFFEPDTEGYYVTKRKASRNVYVYSVIGTRRQLILTEENGVLKSSNFVNTTFQALAYASSQGVQTPLGISIENGAERGFAELLAFVEHVTADLDKDTKGGEDIERAVPINVPLHWKRLLELEGNDRLEIQILDEVTHRDGLCVYTFDSKGRTLDFDPDDSIDVYSQSKKVGELEINVSESINTIAIRHLSRRLSKGDNLYLVDRREQTSIERRSKAVRKILAGQGAIPNLIEYFSADTEIQPTEYRLVISDNSLESYSLNPGQQLAFKSVLRHGPVGLLQGPPGTGKTRFIASLVHWLMTEGGARRILIASQSHEAVNNAIEALISLYKRRGGKPNLLRIGSKGITERIRPYHSAELRERHRVRFMAAIRHRVSLLCSEKGVGRQLTSDVLDIDEKIGSKARLCIRLRLLLHEAGESTIAEQERFANELKRAETAFKQAAAHVTGLDVDPTRPLEELEACFKSVLTKHEVASESDLTIIRHILQLSKDWVNSMGSKSRNFEEFLAKTRSIVTATCVGVGETKIRIDTSQFDWVIVDEAARCTSSELAVPIQLGRRVLLVGDHFQLMPMIKRNVVDELEEEFSEFTREELVRSDFERAFSSSFGQQIGMKLTEQYRMHPDICSLVSRCFYEPHSVTLTTSKDRQPAFVVPMIVPTLLEKAICWVDTATTLSQEKQLSHSTTFHNDHEVDAIIKILDLIASQPDLVESLVRGGEEIPIGIICMYSGQKERLDMATARHAFSPKFRKLFKIDTVDAYQGKENGIIILSLVRCNSELVTGHVGIENRCNVAISRAKERLIVVGSTSMWGSVRTGSPMKTVLEYIRNNPSMAHIIAAEAIQ